MPQILIVDDEADIQRAVFYDAKFVNDDISVDVTHPEDLTEEQLLAADVVLVDFELKTWDSRDATPSMALRPIDGIALTTVLRRHQQISTKNSPVVFALYSAHVQNIWRGMEPSPPLHEFCRAFGLDWVFPKESSTSEYKLDTPELLTQLESLATTSSKLKQIFDGTNEIIGSRFAEEFLALKSDSEWYQIALDDLMSCRPPLQKSAEKDAGLGLARWLLHRIFPYPTFLRTDHYIAQRFGIQPNTLESLLAPGNGFCDLIQNSIYSGALAPLVDRRWWRAGIDHAAWKISDGNTVDAETFAKRVSELSGVHVNPVFSIPHVSTVDENLNEAEMLSQLTDTVRLIPDDWPAYADPARGRIDLVESNPLLASLVDQRDTHLIDDEIHGE